MQPSVFMDTKDLIHKQFMKIALEQASVAAQRDEVPIGAVLVSADGAVLAKGCNRTISACDATAHAEIVVLREAAAKVGNYRLISTTLVYEVAYNQMLQYLF